MNHKTNKSINETTKIWFGKYKGVMIKDLPKNYQNWLSINGFKQIKKYFKDKNEITPRRSS